MEDFSNFLKSDSSFDFESENVQSFLAKISLSGNKKSDAIAIYSYVRDAFIYDPYHLDLRPEALKASVVTAKKRAWCVEKALLCASLFRAIGIPARLGFGVVSNHLGIEKLEHYLQRKEIAFHGFVEALIDEKWVKCTPAFDKRICALSKVEPLNWDAENDSLFQAFANDKKYMEYLHFYGSFDKIPFDLMHSEMKKYYPHLFKNPIDTKDFSFHFSKVF